MTPHSFLNIDETVYETEVPSTYPKPFPGVPDPREVRAFIPGVIADIRVFPGPGGPGEGRPSAARSHEDVQRSLQPV